MFCCDTQNQIILNFMFNMNLFVIYSETHIRQKQFFLEQPEPPPLEPPLQVWHFPNPDGWWFQYWGNPRFPNREKAGFTVAFDRTPMFEPSELFFRA